METPENMERMRTFYRNRNTAYCGIINPETVEMLICDLAELAELDNPFIPLVIKSNGGDTDDGFALASFIEHELGKPVHARVFGPCHSSGTFVLLACAERIGTPTSTFVIHRQTAGITIQFSEGFNETLEHWKQEQVETLQALTRFYAAKLDIPEEVASQLMDRGSRDTNQALSAEEALKLGLLTRIEQHKPAFNLPQRRS